MGKLVDILKVERIIEIEIYGTKFDCLYKTGFKNTEFNQKYTDLFKQYGNIEDLTEDEQIVKLKELHESSAEVIDKLGIKMRKQGDTEWCDVTKEDLIELPETIVSNLLIKLIEEEAFPFGKAQQS